MDATRHVTTVSSSGRQRMLIFTQKNDRFINLLKAKLESYDNEVVITHEMPHKLTPYTACFFCNVTENVFKDIISKHNTRLIFVFFGHGQVAQDCLEHIAHIPKDTIKIVTINPSFDHVEEDMEKLFWFAFSPSLEKFLSIAHHSDAHVHHHIPVIKTVHRKKEPPKSAYDHMNQFIHPRFMFGMIALVVIFFHLLFVPVLMVGTYQNIQAAKLLRDQKNEEAEKKVKTASTVLGISKALYSLVRPSLSLFSLAIVPDDLFIANQSLQDIISNGLVVQEQSKELQEVIFKPNKTVAEIEYISQIKTNIAKNVVAIGDELSVLEDKIPQWNKEFKSLKTEIGEINTILSTTQPFLPYIDWVFGKNEERKYLILFANNMELRPGGGFIGSFAVMSVKNYTLTNLQVYDVYDADGQLLEHVRPPDAIRDYLDQPHWYLRDSAFSPDFFENSRQARTFLDKSMQMRDFDGTILVTTSSIQYILDALPPLYIPDFKEQVTADNFYIKAQLYAEKDFFPGSQQKKTFLSSVMNEMLLSLYSASPVKLFEAIRKALDEKLIVLSFENKDLQKLIDSHYWSGRTITPSCDVSPNPNCIVDYVFPYDANLGVNKANFYITKNEKLAVSIDSKGLIKNTLTVKYNNRSINDIFPGGTYKNYFQVVLPRDITVTAVTFKGKPVTDYTIENDMYTRLGFITEVPPQSQADVTVTYQMKPLVKTGSAIYQLILQKQIGSPNSDMELEITMPKNMYVVNKNFSPVVKDNKIHYNTTLSTDKIFFIEFFLE